MSTFNFTEDQLKENISGRLVGVTATLSALSIILVGLRTYVRCFLSKSFGYDDVATIAALACFLVFAGCIFAGAEYGTGRHLPALTEREYSMSMMMWYIAELFYGASSTLVRISVGLLLLRLTIIPKHRIIIFAVMILSSIIGVVLIFVVMFQCLPIDTYWTYPTKITHGRCMDTKIISGVIYAHGAVASIGDWTLGILPWFFVKNLNMNLQNKITVGLLLCAANFGSVATIIRFKSINQITTSSDFLWNTIDLALWSTIEVGIALPASSVVTLRPLFKRFFGGSSKGGASGGIAMQGYPGASGYVRHTHLSDGQGGTTVESTDPKQQMKGTVTTTVIGNISAKRPWHKKEPADMTNSDEEPLHIRREYDVDIQYSTRKN